MATFHFDLVSPEKLLFSSEVSQVDIPGTEGDFGVLAGHAPIVTTVRPGILVIHGEAGEQLRIVVNGGPDLGRGSIENKLKNFREQHDQFRSAIVNEPVIVLELPIV